LGIHLTKRTDGSVIVGPNASLALGRENYKDSGVNWGEALRMISNIRFARLFADFDFLRIALGELKLSISEKAFLKAAKALVPSHIRG
jgi:L-2-hydroxyglutarate oxidase